jgi:arylsulfatase A
MNRRKFLRQTLQGTAALATAGMGCNQAIHRTPRQAHTRRETSVNTRTRPNVVLILADDLGYGDMSCYGNADLPTPFLDRLAGEGVRLTQHYTCCPLCAPARAGLLTGRYNHRTGALSVESNRGLDRIALRETTIADVFQSAGYATGMVGKWHNGLFDMKHHPNNRGFEEFAGFLNGGMKYYDWILDYNGTPVRSDGRYLTDVFSDESVSFIERHKEEPFFLYVSYNAPHSPHEAPEEEIQAFLETGKFNEMVCKLYAQITSMDKGIGRILETLDKNGLADNTIVLFTSDNGPRLGGYHGFDMSRYNGPFRGMKQDTLEGGIRVPAVVRWPGRIPEGTEFHDMVHFTDWMPTLMAAARIEKTPALPFDGANVLPPLKGLHGKTPDKRFWQFNRYTPVKNCNAAMRDGDWKLYWPRIPEAMKKLKSDNGWYLKMMDTPHFEMEVTREPVERELSAPGQPQLYNIRQDPYEDNDLSSQQPARLTRMKEDLENWFDEVEAERRSLPEQYL